MITVDCMEFEKNMEAYMDQAAEDQEAILIKGEDNHNIVMISEKRYKQLKEGF